MATLSAEQARYYLAGMIDGEGTVTDPTKLSTRSVRITNTDYDLIEACGACCDRLGVLYKIYPRKRTHRGHKRGWDLVVHGRENFERLAKLPLRSQIKRTRLIGLTQSYVFRKRPTRLELVRAYRSDNVTEVARQFRVHFSTAKRWLQKAGLIP